MKQRDSRLAEVWNQKNVPVLLRRGKGYPLLVRVPYQPENRKWLKGEGRTEPVWRKDKLWWELPQAWFERLIKAALEKYGRVYVIQPINQNERCAPACWNALGAECECSCLGANHGSGNPAGKWHVVSETFAVKWGEREYSMRMLTPPAE